MALADTQIKNIKAADKPRKYFDGGALYLHVYSTGGKLWQLTYRFNGKPKTLSFGVYPIVSLKNAREFREDARKLLVKGIDPQEQKKAVKAAQYGDFANSFKVIACEWHSKYSGKWAEKYQNKILARLEQDIFPIIGDKSINNIASRDVLDALRKIGDRGAIETVHRTLQ